MKEQEFNNIRMIIPIQKHLVESARKGWRRWWWWQWLVNARG